MITYQRVTSATGDIHEGVQRLLEFLSANVSDQVCSSTRLRTILANQWTFCLLIACDTEKLYPENMVGMASIVYHRTLTHVAAEINDVVVDPGYRRQGIGEALTRHLVWDARNYGAVCREEVRLSLTSRPSRVEANGLYGKLGLTLVARAEGGQGSNYYRMNMPSPE